MRCREFDFHHTKLGQEIMKIAVAALIVTLIAVSVAEDCPQGWKQFNSKCYFYDSNVYESRHIIRSCQFNLGTPLSIHSAEENDFVKSLITGNAINFDRKSDDYKYFRRRAFLARIKSIGIRIAMGMEG